MNGADLRGLLTSTAQAVDPTSLDRHFDGPDELLPLWIAEPYLEIAPSISAALEARAGHHWVGYETRPSALFDAFWAWMSDRHGWSAVPEPIPGRTP